MLELPQKTLVKIRSYLTRRQRQVKNELQELDKEDPLLMPAVAESSEPGTDSFQADVHARLIAIKANLGQFSKKIQQSLYRLKNGTYGRCESCGKPIEVGRLEAMPIANLCVSCSKKG